MITRTLIALGALAFVGALPATASTPSTRSSDFRALATNGAESAIVLARHGADDGPNHDANDDKGRKKRKRGAGRASLAGPMVVARHGADDGPNHDANDDKGGKKRKRGAGRASLAGPMVVARHGADDGAGHVRKRRDGAGHA